MGEEEQDSIAANRKQMGKRLRTAMMAMLVNATLPNGEVYGHVSCELLDLHEGCEEERTSAEAPSSWRSVFVRS